MTDDEDLRRKLARVGLARAGVALSGVARAGYTPTTEQILQRILVEFADVRTQLAEARKRLERVEAAQAARKPKLQKAQQKATVKRRKKRDAFVSAVDRECRKSDEVTERQAVTAVLKKTGVRGVSWTKLSPVEKKNAVEAGVKRYRLAKYAEFVEFSSKKITAVR